MGLTKGLVAGQARVQVQAPPCAAARESMPRQGTLCAPHALPASCPPAPPHDPLLHLRPPHAGRSGGGQHRVLENRCLGPEGQVACRKGVCHLIAYGGIGALEV